MIKMQYKLMLVISFALMATLCTGEALAQRRGGSPSGASASRPKPPMELSITYGSMWGGNIQTYNGTLRTATGPSYGIALDIPLDPAMALELSYTRQDGGIDYDTRSGKDRLTDMSVNYWQIGAIRGLLDGKVRPWISTSLGATYYSPTEGTVTIEGEDYRAESATKFSFIIGLGAKTYFGKAERFGLRASIKVLPTLYNTGAGVWFGGGGASLGITGNAIWQWEAAIGLTVKLGG